MSILLLHISSFQYHYLCLNHSVGKLPLILSGKKAPVQYRLTRHSSYRGEEVVSLLFIHSAFVSLSSSESNSTTSDDATFFSVANTRSELVLFIPGVTTSLVSFLVWGTTARYMGEIRRLLRLAFCCATIKVRKPWPSQRLGSSKSSRTRGGVLGSGQADDFRHLSETELGHAGAAVGIGGNGIANGQRNGAGARGHILVTTTTQLRVLNSHGKEESLEANDGSEHSEGSLHSPSSIGADHDVGHWAHAYGAAGHEIAPVHVPGRAVAVGTEQWPQGPKVPRTTAWMPKNSRRV